MTKPDGDTPRVFGYARASTKRQVDSPEIQQESMKKYGAMLDLPALTFFVDAAKSGKIPWEERDAGRELFRQLRAGDHIVIAKLDRAFRKLSDCVLVLEKLERMGVKLHICNLLGGAIDLSSPMGRFLIHILAAFAELERAFISERTKDGLVGKKVGGFAHTRHPGYGFRWEQRQIGGKSAKIKVRDDDERAVMRSIVQWRLQDVPLSWEAIRTHLSSTLKLRTKDGGEWNCERIRRAYHAELRLRITEQSTTDHSTHRRGATMSDAYDDDTPEQASPLWGEIDFNGKDIGIPAVPFDKIAVSGRGELLMVSLFTDTVRVKAIRAILCGGAKATCHAGGVKIGRPGTEEWQHHIPGRLVPTEEGYTVFTHKLGYGMAHAVFLTRLPGFLKRVTEETLWQELKSTRFTTPILREWMPWIERRLRDEDRLEDAHGFHCQCGILSATTPSLDAIVSEGLQTRELLIAS